MVLLRRLLPAALVAILGASPSGFAQCIPANGCGEIAGSGCVGASAPGYVGTAHYGTSIDLNFLTALPSCLPNGYQAVAVGLEAPQPYPVLPVPPACAAESPCRIAVSFVVIDFLVAPTGILRLQVPVLPSTTGVSVVFQGTCVRPTQPLPCVSLSRAVRIQMRPAT
ncbi:MAG: hypothetical protein IPM29_07225 [Planctomycetes bacterium]|nr:hypothetical protein [Planctomycetota bacterium]